MIDEAIYLIRGTYIRLFDVYAISAALNVASQYKVKIGFSMISGTVVYILFLFCVLKLCKNYQVKKIKHKLLIYFSCVAIVVAEIFGFSQMNPIDFREAFISNLLVKRKGFALNLVADYLKMDINIPEGYNTKAIEELLNGYVETKDIDNKPTIIAIMNESYSDLSVLGDFKTNESYMNYYSELTENTVKGKMWVSIFGGGTCNTEFEFLTGLSMSFLPKGCIPYHS